MRLVKFKVVDFELFKLLVKPLQNGAILFLDFVIFDYLVFLLFDARFDLWLEMGFD